LQPYLANRDHDDNPNDNPIDNNDNNNNNNNRELSILSNIHPRIKIIQDYSPTHKLLLRRLEPSRMLLLLEDTTNENNNDKDSTYELLQQCLTAHQVQEGPELIMDISYQQLSFSYILSQLLSWHHITPPTAFEQIGHVAHFNLKPQHVPYGQLIGQVLVDTNPTIETVVSKVGQVSGPFRTYDLDILAGPPRTQTTLVEHGLKVALDVATCYWCTRLSGERQVLLSEIQSHQVVADVFCGVGTLCMLANRDKQCTILANDWNPSAMEFFHKNIESNGLDEKDFSLHCGDTYDYLTDLGGLQQKNKHSQPPLQQQQQQQPHRLPDHVVMNFPLEAPKFLGALRWWPSQKVEEHYQEHGSYPRVHVYTFARADKKHTPDPNHNDQDQDQDQPRRTQEQVAVDHIAHELIPEFGSNSIHEPPGKFRQAEMDHEYGTQCQARLVRDVAPGKVVVCVSFSMTPQLLRSMQGDYS
jgi:tRNA G37 N-methylase Trm5